MRWGRAVAVLTAFASASPAFGDPAAADRAIAEAQELAKAGQFVDAAAKFEEAFADDARPELICNVGIAYNKAREWPRAQLFLSRCLERGSVLDSKFMDSVRGVLANVEATLKTGEFTPVDVAVTPGGAVRLDDYSARDAFQAPRVLWVPFGAHHLTASADGYATQRVELVAAGHDPVSIQIALVKATEVRAGSDAGSGSSSLGDGSGSGSAIVGVVEAPHPHPRSRTAAISASAATLVLAGASLFAHHHAIAIRRDAPFALNQDAFDDDTHRVATWNTVFGVTGVLAIAGAAASGFLWFRVMRESRVEVGAAPTAGGAAMTVRGRF